jgi:DNA-binding GntR family transcriptional regulator
MHNALIPIVRKPLREDVQAVLRGRILAGVFPPGGRLQDVQLAMELGVSRTPVREALLRLATEGLVESDPNRGFFVAPLSRREILETYPIVWTLERLALQSCGPPSRGQTQTLRQLNAEMAVVSTEPARRQELDVRWHQTLVEPCGNQRLKDMLTALKQVVRRYESIYMQDPSLVRASTREHTKILKALAKDKTRFAARLLEQHWRSGMESLLKCLEQSGRASHA